MARERDVRPLPARHAAICGADGLLRRRSRSRRRSAPSPTSRSIREALGIAYFRIGRWEEAEAEFRVLVELDPSDEFAHYALGRALVNQGRRKEATPHIKLGRALRPRTPADGDALE